MTVMKSPNNEFGRCWQKTGQRSDTRDRFYPCFPLEPLRKAQEELSDLTRQLGTQEKEKSALIAARVKLKVKQKELLDLKWELEVLEQKYERAKRKFIYFVCLMCCCSAYKNPVFFIQESETTFTLSSVLPCWICKENLT